MHHTLQHSGKLLARADGSNLASLSTEVAVWRALRASRNEPVAVHAAPASNGRPHVRVALKDPRPGQARAVISALFALPVVGRRALRSKLPLWLKIAASAGLLTSAVSLFIGVYPIVDVVSRAGYAVKICSVVAISNLVGLMIYRWGKRK